MNARTSNLDRRDFLKGGALAGAGALAASAINARTAAADEAAAQPAANGWRSWEIKPEPIDPASIAEVVECDICIIGAGAAGVFAAQSAAEEGGNVIVLEKTAQVNGRGLDIGSIDNQFQKDNPELAQYIDATEAERIYYEFSHSSVNRLLFRHWAQISGEAFDHLAAHLKESYGIEPAMSATALPDRYAANECYREMPTCQSFGTGWFDADGNWLMAGVVQKVAAWAEDLGAQFRFETAAEQLVQDESGAVTGVVALTADGTYLQVNAAKGVIIATGDIGGSEEMLKAWCPIALRADGNTYNPAGANTGDGIRMGLWAGAGMQHGFAAPMIHPLGAGGPLAQSGTPTSFLCVNRNGERFTVEINNTPGLSNARLNQPGGIGYTIFDGGYYEKVLKMAPENISIDGSPIVSDTTQATIDAAVAANDGLCFKADTIEELAEQVGIPADTLVATVTRWNELVAAGVDTDMALDPNMLTPLDTPPFYASYIPQSILVIMHGLNCDSHSRVCDENDYPIPGLYAIGNAQGNFFAGDYPLVCPGISHGRCVTFGYTLPKAMLKDELI